MLSVTIQSQRSPSQGHLFEDPLLFHTFLPTMSKDFFNIKEALAGESHRCESNRHTTTLSMTRRSVSARHSSASKLRVVKGFPSRDASTWWAKSPLSSILPKSCTQQCNVRSSRSGGSIWLSNSAGALLSREPLPPPSRTRLWMRSFFKAAKLCKIPRLSWAQQ